MLKSISQSKLKAWEFCPAGFYLQYVLGLDFYNPHFEGGNEFHKSVELYHLGLDRAPRTDRFGRPLGGEDIRDDELIKHYAGTCDCAGKLAHPSVKAEEVLVIDGKPQVEVMLRDIFLEHPKTGRKLELPLTIIIDRVASEDKLSDAKTSNASWSAGKVEDDIQATLYCFAWWQLYGVIPTFEFVVARKNPGPRTRALDIHTTHRDIADFARIWDWAHAIIQEIKYATDYPCTCWDKAHKLMGISL